MLLGQARKYNICKISQSEFTHQNLLDLRAFLQLPLYFCKIVLGQAKKCCICTKYFWARRTKTKFATNHNPNLHIEIYWIQGHFYRFHCTFAELFWARQEKCCICTKYFAPKYLWARRKMQYLQKNHNPKLHIKIYWI